MKKYLTSIACAVALLPGAAFASQSHYSSFDTLSFAATSSSFKVDFSWVDAFFTKTTKNSYSTMELDGKYSWKLIDTTTNLLFAKDKHVSDAISGDTFGVLSGSFSETFTSLTAGHTYKLLFTGDWRGGHQGHHWDLATAPSVSIAAAVPEPETYAMLLAGFGMIGTMVRRRKARA